MEWYMVFWRVLSSFYFGERSGLSWYKNYRFESKVVDFLKSVACDFLMKSESFSSISLGIVGICIFYGLIFKGALLFNVLKVLLENGYSY